MSVLRTKLSQLGIVKLLKVGDTAHRLGYQDDIEHIEKQDALTALPKTSSAPVKAILLVDDRDDTRITTKLFLSHFGYVIESVRSAEEALQLFNPLLHDMVVSDNSMPGMSGVEMAHIIKLRSPSTPVIMFTGLAPEDQSCLDIVIEKPAHLLALKEAVDKTLLRAQSP